MRVEVQPRLAAIVGREHAAVVSEQQMIRVGRIDPQLVVVEVHDEAARFVQPPDGLADPGIGASSVGGMERPVPKDINLLRILRRDVDVAELPPIDAEDVPQILRVRLVPCVAAVIRAIHLAADIRAVASAAGERRPVVEKCIDRRRA